MESECVSCGACVQACPTTALQEKSIIELGMPTRTVKTTCAYCGVGCSFDAEMRGDELVRMTPSKEGGANEGHSCVKGRFAWGYATHRERVTVPMVREAITDEWREVSWDEAIAFSAGRFKASRRSTAPIRSVGSPHRGALTKRSSSSRRWCGLPSVTTTSIPALASATRRPVMALSRPLARLLERKTSSRLSRPTSSC